MRRDTDENRLGMACERVVRHWLVTNGWFVVPMYAIEDGGAPALIGQLRRLILPDIQAVKRGAMRWVEVKGKTRPVLYGKTGRWRHGIDRPNWNDYLRVEAETGIPGDLAIIEMRPGPEASPDPHLLLAPFSTIGPETQYLVDPTPAFPHGAVFWDRDLFERHPIDTKPGGAIPTITPKTVGPWERGQRSGRARQLNLTPEATP